MPLLCSAPGLCSWCPLCLPLGVHSACPFCVAALRTPHCPAAAPHHGLGVRGQTTCLPGRASWLPLAHMAKWAARLHQTQLGHLATLALLLVGHTRGRLATTASAVLHPLSRTGLASQPPPAMAAHLGSLLAPQGPHNQHSTEGAALSQPFVLRSTPLLGSQGLRWILWRLTACTVALAEQPSNSSLHQHPCRCLQTTSATTAEGHFQQSCGSWSQSLQKWGDVASKTVSSMMM